MEMNEIEKLIKSQILIQKIMLGTQILMSIIFIGVVMYICTFVRDIKQLMLRTESALNVAIEKIEAVDIEQLNGAIEGADTLFGEMNQKLEKSDALIEDMDSALEKTNGMISDIDTAMAKTSLLLDDLQEIADTFSSVKKTANGIKEKVDLAKKNITDIFKK